MNKLKTFIECGVYILIIYLTQLVSKYLYTFMVLSMGNGPKGNFIQSLMDKFDRTGDSIGFIQDTKVLYILIGWLLGLILIRIGTDITESFFARKIISRNGIINGLLAIVLGFGLVFVSNGLFRTISEVLIIPSFYGKGSEEIGGTILFNLLLMGILIPICEEIFFRWFLLKKLQKIMPGILAILLQSILFSLAHFNLVQSLFVFGLGFVCGYVVAKTHVIFNGMVVHIIFNVTNIYIYYVMDMKVELGQFVLVLVSGVILTGIGLNNLKYTKFRR